MPPDEPAPRSSSGRGGAHESLAKPPDAPTPLAAFSFRVSSMLKTLASVGTIRLVCREGRAVDALDAARERHEVVTVGDDAPCTGSDLPGLRAVVEEQGDRGGQLGVIAGFDEQSGPAFEELRQRPDPGRDERRPGRHRLESGEGQTFVAGAEDGDVECGR